MVYPLQFSPYDDNESKSIRKNKTIKKKITAKNVNSFLAAMDTNDDLGDYTKTPEYPAHPQKPEPIQKKNEDDNAIESFTQLKETPKLPSNNEYYQQYVPYYTQMNNKSSSHSDELLEKLNYMIHLLEEQQEEKTTNVAEELILYLFLGIFVIFVVDSFARAGKYTR